MLERKLPQRWPGQDSRGHLALPPPLSLPPLRHRGHHLGLRELAFPGNLVVGDSGELEASFFTLLKHCLGKVTQKDSKHVFVTHIGLL